jgi:hypothetical protein
MFSLNKAGLAALGSALIAVSVSMLFLFSTGHRTHAPQESAKSLVKSESKNSGEHPSSAIPTKLAITYDGFDAIGDLLASLGEGYRYELIDEDLLANPTACARFDTIFLTCAEAGPEGLASKTAVKNGIQQFVAKGGTLYASDLRYDLLAAAFPELVDPAAVAQGLQQDLQAEVVSAELREILGSNLPLHFRLDGWRPAAFRGNDNTILLKGTVKTTAHVSIAAPLLVQFRFGKGTVFFTSFHHEKKNSEPELKLLRYLVLKTASAGVESRLIDSMADAGITPRALKVQSSGPGAPTLAQNYDHPQVGALQFKLCCDGSAARMRLEVTSPRGEPTVKRGSSSLTIDVPNAMAGRWKYSAAIEAAPYANFPYLLAVGSPAALDGSDNAEPTSGINANLPLASGNVSFKEVTMAQSEAARSPRIAVSNYKFDDMGKLLRTMGSGFQFETIPVVSMINPRALDDIDILFLTCAPWPGEWAEGPPLKKGDRDGAAFGLVNRRRMTEFGQKLRQFVIRGGTLYASDMCHEMLDQAFSRRKPPVFVNEKMLADLQTKEREWLRLKCVTTDMGTVGEVLKRAGLGPALTMRFDQLVGRIEVSNLVKGGLSTQGIGNAEAAVRGVLERADLPADAADVSAIARGLIDWENAVRNAFEARNPSRRTKVLPHILRAERNLQKLRESIVQDDKGKEKQTVVAHTIDPSLRELIGDTLPLSFNDNGWLPARFKGGDVTVLLSGEYTSLAGTRAEAPLLVKFTEGKGTVIFTSFHNEDQNSDQELTLLRYLVFSAVTAKEEAAVMTMLSGDFSPVKRSQISHSSGPDSVTRTYKSPRPGPLRFALTFAGRGARLRLTLVAPGKQRYEKEFERTAIVEATGAPAGEWNYTVTSIRVPYDKYPFSVNVGEGSPPSRPR